jgi:putative peptidoglycan lipid II flippase
MPTTENLDNNKARTIGLLGVITFFSRILGLVREMVVAAFLGTSIFSDAFTLAFSLPDLFRRLFSEGALVNAFIPAFITVKSKQGPQQALDFASNLLIVLTGCLGSVCIVFIVLAPIFIKYTFAWGYSGPALDMTILLTRILFGYILFISMASVYQGVLNSFSVFWVSSLTPVLLNLSIISVALLLSPYLKNPAIGFAIGVMLGGMVQFLFHVPFAVKLGFRIKLSLNWKDAKTREVLRLMIPSLFGIGIYQINVMISNIIAATLQTGSVSSLKFSNRLLELIIGVFVVSFTTVILPKYATFFMENNQGGLQKNLESTIGILTFFTIPITFGGFLLSEEIITILLARGEFDHQSIVLTSSAFRYHIIGLSFIAWNRVLLTCYQAAGRITRIVQVGIVVVLVNIATALILKDQMGHTGLALAGSISQALHTLMLVFFLRDLSLTNVTRIFFNRTAFFCIIAAILMWVAVFLIKHEIDLFHMPQILRLALYILTGALVYFSGSILFKNKNLKDSFRRLLKRK